MRFTLVNVIAFASLVAVALLWSQPFVLLLALSTLSFGALFIERSKQAFILYALCAVLGSAAEAFAVAFGAWSYATPQFVGIPFWLIPLWGLAGVYIAALSTFLGRR